MKPSPWSAIVFLAVMFLAFTLAVEAAAQKQQQSYYLKPDQTIDLTGQTKLITAKQNCENWALAAGLDPADYPVVPGGVPQAWERARLYLGLCDRYQELYQAQLADLRLLMTTAPAPGDPRPAG